MAFVGDNHARVLGPAMNVFTQLLGSSSRFGVSLLTRSCQLKESISVSQHWTETITRQISKKTVNTNSIQRYCLHHRYDDVFSGASAVCIIKKDQRTNFVETIQIVPLHIP